MKIRLTGGWCNRWFAARLKDSLILGVWRYRLVIAWDGL